MRNNDLVKSMDHSPILRKNKNWIVNDNLITDPRNLNDSSNSDLFNTQSTMFRNEVLQKKTIDFDKLHQYIEKYENLLVENSDTVNDLSNEIKSTEQHLREGKSPELVKAHLPSI